MCLAQCAYEGDDGKGFRILYKYISGGNVEKQKFDLMKPVMIGPTSEKTSKAGPKQQIMSFVLPSDGTVDMLPVPNDNHVKLTQVEPEVVAVRQFSGSATPKSVEPKTVELLAALKRDGIATAKGANARLATYNPPWTIPACRTNEVMVRVLFP
mmetsp:Transcript_13653/g.23391  ORF Transcript_13653/g.23391 Transcript_13653/m.23391 type:complete len:154 (-) Transcript_13653:475-936(-)